MFVCTLNECFILAMININKSQDFGRIHLLNEIIISSDSRIGQSTRKIDSCKKYFTVRAISEHIIRHCVAIIAAIHCVLVDTIVSALSWERNPIHETNDVIHQRFSLGP